MNIASLILRIVAIVAAVIAGVLFFMGQGQLKDSKAKLAAEQTALQASKSELADAEEKAASLEAKLANSEKKLKSSQKKLDSVRIDLANAKRQVSNTQPTLTAKENEIKQLSLENSQLTQQLARAKEQTQGSDQSDEIDALNTRITQLEAANEKLETELESKSNSYASSSSSMTNAITTATATSTTATAAAAAAATETPVAQVPAGDLAESAMIASVSAKDGIVVLKTGFGKTFQVGSQFTLAEDLVAVGAVEISSTTGEYAIANILPNTKKSRLKVGAHVRFFR